MENPGVTAVEFGLNTFGEIVRGPDGRDVSDAESVRMVIADAVLAERVGLDSFSIGEHYRPDQVDTASMVALAAAAGRTERITLGTAVAVLSTQDPVRLYHQYATLDAASSGRARLVLGRASATESFPLFGFGMDQYDQLFEENLELFLQLLRGEPVTWSGIARPALAAYSPRPRLDPGAAKPWIGIGGSPESVVRAARHNLPLMMAVIGGPVARFAAHSRYYRDVSEQLGLTPEAIGLHSIGFIADTDGHAVDTFWPLYRSRMEVLAAERGFRRPDRRSYVNEIEEGALFIGSPETVAAKIATAVEVLGLSRFDLKYDTFGMSTRDRARTIELLGTAVKPLVERGLGADEPRGTAPEAAISDPRTGGDAIFGGRSDELGRAREAQSTRP